MFYEAKFAKLFDHTNKFSIRRQTLVAPDTNVDDNLVVVSADWISKAERDAFDGHPDLTRAGQEFMSLLDNSPEAPSPSPVVYHFDFPTGPATTPIAGTYILCFMKCPVANQPAFAATMDAYLRGIFLPDKFDSVFHHMAVAREDPEIVVSFQGWKTKKEADEYMIAKEHTDFYPAVSNLVTISLPIYQADLKPYVPSSKSSVL
ncbi:hypothetical protein FQN57_007280 [Myotisia sp. PD_48]|nr:hypothetical protein FQN57_007280 [Myotisia sp. PD_48]